MATSPEFISHIPDEIVIHILIRVHVKDVLQCRCVCKRWRDLTSTPHFVELHKQFSDIVQMILIEDPMPINQKGRKDHYFVNKWWLPETDQKSSTFVKNNSYPRYVTQFSQQGLLVMQSKCRHKVLIVNPVTRDEVRIVDKRKGYCFNKVYGIFFNPKLEEYCVLFGVAAPAPAPVSYVNDKHRHVRDYKILNLGPKPCWRDVRNPWNSRDRFQKWCPYEQWACPVFISECLYWMVDSHGDIMEFDIRNDKFTLLQCPLERNAGVYGQSGIDLLNIDGYLSLVHISEVGNGCNISIWTMKDHATQLWTNSNFVTRLFIGRRGPYAKSIAVEYGELVIKTNEPEVFVCNIKQGTGRFIAKPEWKRGCNNKWNIAYNYGSKFFSYVTSLSSLKNCKRVIHIEGDEDEKIKDDCKVCNCIDRAESSSSRVGKQ